MVAFFGLYLRRVLKLRAGRLKTCSVIITASSLCFLNAFRMAFAFALTHGFHGSRKRKFGWKWQSMFIFTLHWYEGVYAQWMNYIHYQKKSKSIFCVDMRQEVSKPWSSVALRAIDRFVRDEKRILFLVWKKWYASGTVCWECGHIPRCQQCDIAIAVHQNDNGDMIWLCHICRRQYNIDAQCKQCNGTDTHSYWLWSQQVAEWLEERYNIDPFLVDQTTANSPNKIKKVLAWLWTNKYLVATSLVSSGIPGWKPDLVVLVHGDMWLQIPDYQASWNNFCFLFDCFHNFSPEHFIIQTYNPESSSIKYACSFDKENFLLNDHAYRKQFLYPPYSLLCVLHYKHEQEKRVMSATNKLFQELLYCKDLYTMEDVVMFITPPLLYKKFWKFRYTIILKWPSLKEFMDIVYSKLQIQSRGFKVDWNPQQLL